MDQQTLEQQLQATKAAAFDLYQQLQQQANYIQFCQSVLQKIAEKLGVQPGQEGSMDIEQLMFAVDRLVMKHPENSSNNVGGESNG